MKNLLNYLEEKGEPVERACCGGFCGACRFPKDKIKVKWEYEHEPLAYYNDDEVVTCVAVVISENNG